MPRLAGIPHLLRAVRTNKKLFAYLRLQNHLYAGDLVRDYFGLGFAQKLEVMRYFLTKDFKSLNDRTGRTAHVLWKNDPNLAHKVFIGIARLHEIRKGLGPADQRQSEDSIVAILRDLFANSNERDLEAALVEFFKEFSFDSFLTMTFFLDRDSWSHHARNLLLIAAHNALESEPSMQEVFQTARSHRRMLSALSTIK